MVYNTKNYWVSGLCPSSGILNSMKSMDLFPPSGEGRETPTLLGPLERSNLNHWTDPISNTFCFLVFRISDDGQSP
jgi:hypothetical protein